MGPGHARTAFRVARKSIPGRKLAQRRTAQGKRGMPSRAQLAVATMCESRQSKSTLCDRFSRGGVGASSWRGRARSLDGRRHVVTFAAPRLRFARAMRVHGGASGASRRHRFTCAGESALASGPRGATRRAERDATAAVGWHDSHSNLPGALEDRSATNDRAVRKRSALID